MGAETESAGKPNKSVVVGCCIEVGEAFGREGGPADGLSELECSEVEVVAFSGSWTSYFCSRVERTTSCCLSVFSSSDGELEDDERFST